MPDIIPGAEPFFMRGGPVGALVLHGFTGAPKEMRPLAEALAAQGCTVLGPRLTHHGTLPSDMMRSHWRDWFNAALDGYYLLRDQCRHIFVMGLSMGGVIALRLAAQYPMAGVVAMSAPSLPLYDTMDWRARIAGPLSYLVPFMTKTAGPSTDPAMQAAHVDYPAYPLRSIPQLRALLRDTAAHLPQVQTPALVIHSRGDESVPTENARYIYEHLGSADKKLLWLEKSGHVVTEECERGQVFAWATAFVKDHS